MSIVVTSSFLVVNSMVNEKVGAAAEIFAEDLAGRIVNAVVNVALMKDEYPNANYSTTIDLPFKLVDHYTYYVDINDEAVFINSSLGEVHVKKSIYNSSKRISMNLKGQVYGSEKLTISCEDTNYIYRFDLGNQTSPGERGYIRISEESETPPLNWWDNAWKYNTTININNPMIPPATLDDYQILIQLNDSNIDHSLFNENLLDLVFVKYDYSSSSYNRLNYWIESWFSNTTHSSRIWVKIPELPEGGCDIYMYYGNTLAPKPNPDHDGDQTFLFFDDFSNGLGKWSEYYGHATSKIKIINDDKLYLANGSAVISNTYINHDDTPHIIETKARSEKIDITSETLEASLFVRSKNNTNPPYKNGFVFSSGQFKEGYNSTIIRYATFWENLSNANKRSINEKNWYRLKYILNNSVDVIARYYDNNFTLDDESEAILYNENLDGQFGLCTANTKYMGDPYHEGLYAYYDWIFVRKFVGNTDMVDGTRRDFEPIAHVNSTVSTQFGWTNSVNSEYQGEPEIGKDFNYGSGLANFRIVGLIPNDKYSLLFTVGDSTGNSITNPGDLVTGMQINVEGNIIDAECTDSQPYKKYWISDVPANGLGEISISFSDNDNTYWAVSEITVEQSERIIYMHGGGPE